MIAYMPFRGQIERPFIGQAASPSNDILAQLLQLQEEIGTIIAGIPKGSVDQARIDAITRKLEQCSALGPTAEALKCLTDLRSDIQAVPTAPKPPAPAWPWIVGGVAVLGAAAALFIFSK